MRILIVTDAWPPQVNGVVRTLQTVGRKASSNLAMKFIMSRLMAAEAGPCPATVKSIGENSSRA